MNQSGHGRRRADPAGEPRSGENRPPYHGNQASEYREADCEDDPQGTAQIPTAVNRFTPARQRKRNSSRPMISQPTW